MKGFGLVEVGPDVEDDVPGEFQDLEEHDDGDAGEETQSSSKRRNEVIGLEEKTNCSITKTSFSQFKSSKNLSISSTYLQTFI